MKNFTSKLVFLSFLVISLLVILEIATRILGYQPGIFKKYIGFQIVDELETYQLYTLDSNGIYSLNSQLIDSVSILPREDVPGYVFQENVLDVIADFRKLQEDKKVSECGFDLSFTNDIDSQFHYLVQSYLKQPINDDGFRSIPFVPYSGKAKKILLLGDSFVYGLSANPICCSYSDLLLSNGYVVYNTGINGTDPAQYLAILKKYLRVLEPDLILLNFSSESDFMTFPRIAKEGQAHEHQTNAGFIESAPLGTYLNAEESYQFYKNFISVPKSSLLYSVCQKSTAFSLIYGVLVDTKLVYHPQHTEYYNIRSKITAEDKARNTKMYIDEINQIAIENNIPIINAIVPIKPASRLTDKQFSEFFVDTNSLNISFANYIYHYPKSLDVSDYEEHGSHFTNKGSEKFAVFLDSLILTNLKSDEN